MKLSIFTTFSSFFRLLLYRTSFIHPLTVSPERSSKLHKPLNSRRTRVCMCRWHNPRAPADTRQSPKSVNENSNAGCSVATINPSDRDRFISIQFVRSASIPYPLGQQAAPGPPAQPRAQIRNRRCNQACNFRCTISGTS